MRNSAFAKMSFVAQALQVKPRLKTIQTVLAAQAGKEKVVEFKKPKSVLIISSIFHPHVFGGAEIAAYNRAKLLAKRGYNVSVATLQERSVPPSWGNMCPEGFKLYRIKAPRQYTLLERTGTASLTQKMIWHLQDYFDKRNRRLVGAVLNAVKPDYIEIDNLIGIGFNALSEIGRRNVPVTYILHDLNLVCFNTGMIRKGKTCQQQCVSCRGVASLRQTHLNKIKKLGFISPSHANLEQARKYIPALSRSTSCVIQNLPEEMPPLRERQNSDRVRLAYVGRLDPVKGIDFMLGVLDGLSKNHDFIITILGTGPSEQKLRAKYGDRPWADFRGFVPKSEVTNVLQESDLYCIPSLVRESYGLVTAQALQLGTPVIGSNSGGTAELVRDGLTGKLVPPGNETAWREAFQSIFSNREMLAAWRENASARREEFDENIIGAAYEEFIGKLCTSDNPED